MASSANNHTPNESRPTGDLEHLFRQKLGEAEVAPRQHVWEQLDHELLVRQNDSYRRRLLLHRWIAAACALLVLGCGSWLLLHNATHLPPSTEIAATTRPAEETTAEATADTQLSAPRSSATTSQLRNGATTSTDVAAVTEQPSSAATASAALAATSQSATDDVASTLLRAAKSAVGITQSESSNSVAANSISLGSSAAVSSLTAAERQAGNGAYSSAFVPSVLGIGNSQNELGANWLTARPVPAAAERNTVAAAFRRPETLQPETLPASANMLAQAAINAPQETAEEEKPERKRSKWRLSGAYAASSYNPNIDFSSSATANAALDFGAVPSNNSALPAYSARSAYQYGASEYRDNLEAGPAQRIAIAAAYALNNKWTLLTGVETSQQRASSKTSLTLNDTRTAFAGQAASDSSRNQFYAGQRGTEFRYSTVGVPVAMRYGSAKTGWSLYAKVGAAVNLLIKSSTEVDGTAAAARDYTLSSSESPYRKVLASVRGGGGVRYAPAAAAWSLSLGPVAEAGLNTLNQDPGGSFFQRSRPYSVGLEASVEFGGQKSPAVVR
ncbi:hypothetical protein H8B13_05420 [Hymenobacter sp. BT188]|uniref:hypothetical protein n=1 Tax=Hymenobacter sp. BT188 TaxID=2763504 RepID=UPI001650DFE4|nr:hypothetical protein [Hymenobacter sp. BT188]MBC6606251.1 hypothetical protein [Hymenobacter sp. BT188]